MQYVIYWATNNICVLTAGTSLYPDVCCYLSHLTEPQNPNYTFSVNLCNLFLKNWDRSLQCMKQIKLKHESMQSLIWINLIFLWTKAENNLWSKHRRNNNNNTAGVITVKYNTHNLRSALVNNTKFVGYIFLLLLFTFFDTRRVFSVSSHQKICDARKRPPLPPPALQPWDYFTCHINLKGFTSSSYTPCCDISWHLQWECFKLL